MLARPISVYAFVRGGRGGNPCTIYPGEALKTDEMLLLAARQGHECCFILPAGPSSSCDVRMRFFAPAQEMEMCGHATLAAAWLLMEQGTQQSLTIETTAGPVEATHDGGRTWITQPAGWASAVDDVDALEALGLSRDDLDRTRPVLNAASTRSKTMVPLRSRAILDGLSPDPQKVTRACEAAGSTGLYPYVADPGGLIHARQFPAGAGYVEDPATGLAAAALFEALGRPRGEIIVHQGDAMGRPSEIAVHARQGGTGCRIGGMIRALAAGEPTTAL